MLCKEIPRCQVPTQKISLRASLCYRHWPNRNSRHFAAMSLALVTASGYAEALSLSCSAEMILEPLEIHTARTVSSAYTERHCAVLAQHAIPNSCSSKIQSRPP
jgi:hypothetical protein